MRRSRTASWPSVFCAPPGLGPGNTAVRRGQAGAAGHRGEGQRRRGHGRPVEAPGLPRGGPRHRPEAHGGRRRTFPASVTVVGGQQLEQQRADDFQDLVPLVPGLSVTTDQARGHPHHPARHQHRRRGLDDRRLLRRRAVRVEHRPGQRRHRRPATSTRSTSRGSRCCGARRAPCTERARSAASSSTFRTGPTPRGSRRRFMGSAETVDNGDPGYSLTGLVNVPLGDKAAVRASGFYRLRQRLHRFDRQQPDPQPHESGRQRHRRHPHRGRPELARPVRRALGRCCSSPPTSSRSTWRRSCRTWRAARPARSMPTRRASSR